MKGNSTKPGKVGLVSRCDRMDDPLQYDCEAQLLAAFFVMENKVNQWNGKLKFYRVLPSNTILHFTASLADFLS